MVSGGKRGSGPCVNKGEVFSTPHKHGTQILSGGFLKLLHPILFVVIFLADFAQTVQLLFIDSKRKQKMEFEM